LIYFIVLFAGFCLATVSSRWRGSGKPVRVA